MTASSIRLALAGDTILTDPWTEGHRPSWSGFLAPEVAEAAGEADLFVLNLECCISERGEPLPKVYRLRASPAAAEELARLGVDCVTLANNHVLDFGPVALLDTFEHLDSVGIHWAGAGPDLESARRPVVLEHEGFRLGVAAVTDHPAAFAARPGVPGVAFAPPEVPNPGWLMGSLEAVGGRADAVLLSRHWGPNYAPRPIARVRAAAEVSRAHATVVAGHSAHVFHGVEQNVLYDLGDFVHHYGRDIFPSRSLARRLGHVLEDLGKIPGEAREASLTRSESRSSFVRLQRDRVDRLLRRTRVRRLRPDHGLLFLLEIDGRGLRRLEAVPLRLGPRRTVLAGSRDGAWTLRRFGAACRALGTHVRFEGGRAVITWS